jgi:hypothetical protein
VHPRSRATRIAAPGVDHARDASRRRSLSARWDRRLWPPAPAARLRARGQPGQRGAARDTRSRSVVRRGAGLHGDGDGDPRQVHLERRRASASRTSAPARPGPPVEAGRTPGGSWHPRCLSRGSPTFRWNSAHRAVLSLARRSRPRVPASNPSRFRRPGARGRRRPGKLG